jgi:hypothetical protein
MPRPLDEQRSPGTAGSLDSAESFAEVFDRYWTSLAAAKSQITGKKAE